jgi:hypothetical protein
MREVFKLVTRDIGKGMGKIDERDDVKVFSRSVSRHRRC